MLPSMPTHWCGQPEDLRMVVDHLDRHGHQARLSAGQPAPDLRPHADRVAARRRSSRRYEPIRKQFVGQEEVALSTAPTWSGQRDRAAVARAADVRRGGRRLLRRDARRVDTYRRLGARRRSSRCSAAAAARTRGCSRTVRSARCRCWRRRRSRFSASGAPAICRAAWPTISSGSAATPSVRSISSGCCAPS